MSGSQSSSDEDQSSGGSSSDEGSEEESGSDSGSSSGSDDETGSVSGSGSSNGSDSGSSSGEDSDNGSSSSSGSDDSGDSEDGEEEEDQEEEETEGEDKEKRMASKREDFEKMKEISAHMDNIVQRLATFFPLDDNERKGDTDVPPPPVEPEVPSLPLLPTEKERDRSVSARVMTMDRAVSARRLMTDRAVSVASGLHFDDDRSGSTVSNNRYEDQQHAERRRGGRGDGMTNRAQSGTDADWGEGEMNGRERRVGTRNRHQAGEAGATKHRRATTDSLADNEKNTNNADKRLGQKREPGMGRRRSRVPLGSPGANFGAEGPSSHERLLWDELRESLEGVAGSEGVPAPSMWGRVGPVEKTKAERIREEQRRRLIDEAIAVLLEGSSSSSSEDERLESDAV